MQCIKQLIVFGIVLSLWNQISIAEEIVLQNDLNGYNGCVDAHISTGQEQGSVNSNFSNGQTINCGYHHRL